MIATQLLYGLLGVALFALGVRGTLADGPFLRRVMAWNVAGAGVFLIFVAGAYGGAAGADPVPHALVLTGIVVAVSATALALALARRLKEAGPHE